MKKAIIIALTLISLISCKPHQIVSEIIIQDTTIIREVPRIVTVPGAVIQSPRINIDSLAQLLRANVPVETINQTLIREDPETRLRVGILIDELGNLTALCEQQDRIIEMMTQEIERLKKVQVQKEPIKRKTWLDAIEKISFYILLALIVILLIRALKLFFNP